MYKSYSEMKAVGRATVAKVNDQPVLRRQYYDRNGTPESLREDVLSIGYMAAELKRLIAEIADLKLMAADFATVEEMTISELREAVNTETKGL